MKYCIRVTIISCAVVLLFLANFSNPGELYATPPQALTISYKANTQILTVTITHKSAFTSFHYIKYVEIKKNGFVISNNTYDSQPDPKTFTYMYKVPAANGDKLEVTASCSLWGHKTVNLTVGQAK